MLSGPGDASDRAGRGGDAEAEAGGHAAHEREGADCLEGGAEGRGGRPRPRDGGAPRTVQPKHGGTSEKHVECITGVCVCVFV